MSDRRFDDTPSEGEFDDRPVGAGFPEVVDDDSPERDRYPEPQAPALPSDDGYPGSGSVGTTVEEQVEGESLDRKLAQEEFERPIDPLQPPGVNDFGDEPSGPGAGPEAGQLSAPDLGGSADTEKDEIAEEGARAYDEAPEERAMRVESEEG